jgi:Protein of unknown function (DUF1353)
MGQFLTKPALVSVKRTPIQGIFESPADVEILPQPDLFALAAPLIYRTAAGLTIKLPTGLTTDFASIPKALDWIGFLDINGPSRLAGALHDGGYRLGQAKGKAFWDDILREACLDLGMNAFQAGTYYQAVHWFAGKAWTADAALPNAGGKFVDEASYDAFMASGGSVFVA